MRPLGDRWPLPAGALLLALLLCWLLRQIASSNHGVFAYGLDDAYIHLSVARSLAEHGVWGLTPSAPTGSSSSPLWTLLLAALIRLVGPNPYLPLLLNAAVSGWVLSLLHRLMLPIAPALRFGLLLAILLVIPLPTLVFNGMEHLLQVALVLEFLVRLDRIFLGDKVSFLVLSFLAVAVRYEAIFVVGGVAALLLERGRWKEALPGLLAAVLPILIYGIWLKSEDWPFFPAGLVLRTGVGQPSWGTALLFSLLKATENLYASGMLLPLVGCGLLWRGPGRERIQVMGVATVLHTLLASFGSSFRYEAYLYAGMLGSMAPVLVELLRRGFAGRISGALFVLLGVLGLGERGVEALATVTSASSDIYRQQMQMAAFLRQYYRGETVVANDIGAITFFGEVEVMDLAGLGTKEMLALRDPRLDRTRAIADLASLKGAPIGIFYESWLKKVPPSWERVETWTVPDPHVLGGATVSFFAVKPEEAERLRQSLLQFRMRLPAEVQTAP